MTPPGQVQADNSGILGIQFIEKIKRPYNCGAQF
jgi:hypothetical protein